MFCTSVSESLQPLAVKRCLMEAAGYNGPPAPAAWVKGPSNHGPLGALPKWKELGRHMAKGKHAGIANEVFQLLNCCSLVLGGWVHVAHGHLDVSVAGEFA